MLSYTVTSRGARRDENRELGRPHYNGFMCHPYKDSEHCGLGIASFN